VELCCHSASSAEAAAPPPRPKRGGVRPVPVSGSNFQLELISCCSTSATSGVWERQKTPDRLGETAGQVTLEAVRRATYRNNTNAEHGRIFPRARKRTRDALPKMNAETLATGTDLLKEAKGIR